MQYEYIGHTPNDSGFTKGQTYFINPKRTGSKLICNILTTEYQLHRNITKQIITIVYADITDFRKDWKPVLSDLTQNRKEPAELK